MARFTRMQTLQAMYDTGLVPVFYNPDPEIVINVVRACAEAGVRLIEFTNRGDNAIDVFSRLEEYCAKELPEVITGIGSIVEPGTAALYINRGANFIVGPNTNPEVARLCNRRKIAYAPGAGSVTEISAAEELGCEIIKVFPAGQVGGPEFIKAVRGPCPWSSLMPTGGVEPTRESLTAWFSAGIACAGMGSNLITKEILAKKDYAALTAKAREAMALIAEIRRESAGK